MQPANIEKIVKHETLRLNIAGILLIFAGISLIVFKFAEMYGLIQPIALGRFSTAINILLLLAFIIPSSRAITKKLIKSSQDEYEYHLDIAAKAKAFNFLNYSVLAIALLFSGAGQATAGLIAILVGISWIMVARGAGALMSNHKLINNLKVLRAKHSLTQEELAAKVGVSRKTINVIEGGDYAPSVLLALEIARVFDVSVEDVFNI